MALIPRNEKRIAALFVEACIIRGRRASVALTPGQAVYPIAATGKVAPTNATNAATTVLPGIVLDDVLAEDAPAVLEQGWVTGFDLSGLQYGAPVYLGNTPGTLDDAPGTVNVMIGRVDHLNDGPARTKVLRVFGPR